MTLSCLVLGNSQADLPRVGTHLRTHLGIHLGIQLVAECPSYIMPETIRHNPLKRVLEQTVPNSH